MEAQCQRQCARPCGPLAIGPQVEVTAASQEDLQAWERRVLCKLRKLACLLDYPSNLGDQVSAQACLRAFRCEAPAADGRPPHPLSLLFVGVARKQASGGGAQPAITESAG